MPTEYFEQRERALLGQRYEQLYAAPQQTAERGVTVSALRTTPEQFAQRADFPLEPSPFCKAAFVVHQPDFKPGRHPYHHAGVFYSQEPSASSAAPLLGVQPGMRVLDLCAGTGCLGIGIRHFVPSASVTCVEKSPQALQYLQANVHGTGVQAKAADVLQYWRELMPQSVQLIISNPPYLTGAEMQALMPETAHEPAMALDGGTDGLDFYRAIAAHYRDIVLSLIHISEPTRP